MNHIKLPKALYVTSTAAEKLLESIGDTSTWLDFGNAQVINGDFCDALFMGIYRLYETDPDFYVGIKDMNYFIRKDAVRSAEFVRDSLAIPNFGFVAYDSAMHTITLIGAIQPSVVAGWELTRTLGELTPGRWRRNDGNRLTLAAYSGYLKEAHHAHILHRKEVNNQHGFVYYLPPKPEGV